MKYEILVIPLILLIISRTIGLMYPMESLPWSDYTKTAVQPPGYIFGIVWTILYFLMGLIWYNELVINDTFLTGKLIIPLLLLSSFLFTPLYYNKNFTWSNAMILFTLLFTIFLLTKLLLDRSYYSLLVVPWLTWLIQALIFQSNIAVLEHIRKF